MPKKILIVEDEDIIAKVLSIRLESQGFKTIVAYDGEEGLKKTKSEKPDLVIIDIGLPKIDGNFLCELIKKDKHIQNIPVIMLTGKKLVQDMETAFNSGADVYINKPYNWERLLHHIQKLLK